jgi:hypothetical protein
VSGLSGRTKSGPSVQAADSNIVPIRANLSKILKAIFPVDLIRRYAMKIGF